MSMARQQHKSMMQLAAHEQCARPIGGGGVEARLLSARRARPSSRVCKQAGWGLHACKHAVTNAAPLVQNLMCHEQQVA